MANSRSGGGTVAILFVLVVLLLIAVELSDQLRKIRQDLTAVRQQIEEMRTQQSVDAEQKRLSIEK